MAALLLVRKMGIPVATASSLPLFGSVIFADSGKNENSAPASRMVRPSDLPIYEEPKEVLDFEFHGKERTALEENIGVVRKEIEKMLEATHSVRERALHVYETGKAHTMVTVDYITDEENILPRAGAITVGGLAGLVIGARKRGGFFKKVLYTSTGVVGAASLCYPRQAYHISQQVFGNVKDYATIGYNFIAGVKPQSKVSAPVEHKEVATPTAAEVITTEPTGKEPAPAAPTTTTQSEGAEVRSVVPQIISLQKLPAPFDTLAQQASDITLWGFRLIDRTDTVSRSPTDLVLSAEPTVPQGFGSVEDSNKLTAEMTIEHKANKVGVQVKDIGKGKDTYVPEVAEPVLRHKTSDIATVDIVGTKSDIGVVKTADFAETKVADVNAETTVQDPVDGESISEKVACFVEEKAAEVVVKAAQEVEKDAADVAAGAEFIEEIGSKVEPVLKTAENVMDAASKAARYTPGVPETITEKVALVKDAVKEADTIVKNVTGVAESVDKAAEEFKREAEIIISQATEVVESEEKREEIYEKVVDFVTGGGGKSAVSDEVKETSKVPDTAVRDACTEIYQEPSADITDQLKLSDTHEKELLQTQGEPGQSPDTDRKVIGSEADKSLTITKDTDISIVSTPDKKGLFYEIINFFSKENKVTPVVEHGTSGEDTFKTLHIEPETTTDDVLASSRETPEKAQARLTPDDTTVTPTGLSSLSKDETLPHSIGEVLEPVIESVAKDIVVDVADKALKTVSEVVKETAEDVVGSVSDVLEVTDVVKEIDQKVVPVLDDINKATEEVPKVPWVTESVAVTAKFINQISEETENVVETVTFVAEEVHDVAENIKNESIAIEHEAAELVQSEEKREELIQNIIDYVADSKLSSLGKTQNQDNVEVSAPPAETSTQSVVKEGSLDQPVKVVSDHEHDHVPPAAGKLQQKTAAEPFIEKAEETIDTEEANHVAQETEDPNTSTKSVAAVDNIPEAQQISHEVPNILRSPGPEVIEQPNSILPEKKSFIDKIAKMFSDKKEPLSVPSGGTAEISNVNLSSDALTEGSVSVKTENSHRQSTYVLSSSESKQYTPMPDSTIPTLGEVQEPSQGSDSLLSSAEESALQAKDSSDTLAKLVSTDDKPVAPSPLDTRATLQQERLAQTGPITKDVTQSSTASGGVVNDSELSLVDRVANIFTRKESVKEETVQSCKNIESRVAEESKTEMAIDDNAKMFVVRTNPRVGVDQLSEGDHDKNAAAVPVWRGSFRVQ
ncbi:microtubule-associated protein futsch isoform X2 [Cherax quadricarinatus]